MMPVDRSMLAMILGGAKQGAKPVRPAEPTPPPALTRNGGCVALTGQNEAALSTWFTTNAKTISRDQTGNYTRKDGPYPAIYGYEYWRGSRCAPGADD